MPSMIRKQQRSWFGLNRESEEERVEDEFRGNLLGEGLCRVFGLTLAITLRKSRGNWRVLSRGLT